jgi:hypothetical protein
MANEYVNNAAFLQALKEYKAKVREAEEVSDPKPRVPNYIGECILKIATHLSYKPNFINYTYREEMVSDGIENCLMYLDNFDPDKYSNPFAYFTQIIWYAFIRRIQKEKKQTAIKTKIAMDMPIEEGFDIQEFDEDNPHSYMSNDYGAVEDNLMQADQVVPLAKSKQKRKKTATLDDLFE